MEGVDKLLQLVTGLEATVAEVAPQAWAIMVHGQLTKARVGFAAAVILFAVTAYLVSIARHTNNDDVKFATVIGSFVLGVIAFIVGTICLPILLAPEYYVIRELIRAARF